MKAFFVLIVGCFMLLACEQPECEDYSWVVKPWTENSARADSLMEVAMVLYDLPAKDEGRYEQLINQILSIHAQQKLLYPYWYAYHEGICHVPENPEFHPPR